MQRTIVLLLMLCTSAMALAKEPATAPATQAASGTRYGHRVLSVNSSAYSPDFSELIALVNRKAAELGPTLLNIPAKQMDAPVFAVIVGGRGQSVELDLEFSAKDLPNARPAAKEFLSTLVATIETFVREDFESRRAKELAMARRDQDVCSKQLDEATAQAQDLRAKLRDMAGRADVSAQGVTSAVSRLEEEKEKIELDLLGKKARREALEKEIAEQSAALQKQAETDPVARELKTIVEVRTAKLDNLRKIVESGQASQGELNDAIAAVAEARAKLAERQRDGGGNGPIRGETLEALARERVNLSIDLRELEARLEFVEKRLPSLRSTMDRLDALQRAEGDLKNARDALAASTTHLRDLSRRLETADPPQVLVKTITDRERP